jgi:hypothetical protein
MHPAVQPVPGLRTRRIAGGCSLSGSRGDISIDVRAETPTLGALRLVQSFFHQQAKVRAARAYTLFPPENL